MTRSKTWKLMGLGMGFVPLLCALASAAWIEGPSRSEPPRALDPARVVGPQECAECHESENAVWLETAHQAGSKILTRDARAREIASALGIKRMKTDARCASCHFTLQGESDASKSIAGVSCESCHGAAREWVTLHDDFGPAGTTSGDEDPDHRRDRLDACRAVGMHHPDRISGIASTCFGCHFVWDRELTETAGHPTGDDFELLRWSQGEIRHNFVRGDGTNAEASASRKRAIWFVGQVLDLESSLEVMTLGLEAGVPREDALLRARRTVATLDDAAGRVSIPELGPLLEVLRASPLEEASPARLQEWIDTLRALLTRFESEIDGAALQALDELLPTAEEYVGVAR